MGPSRTLLAAAAAAAVVLVLGSHARAQAPRAGAPTPGEAAGSRVAVELATAGNLSRGLVYRDLITNRGVLQLWDGPWGVYLQPYWLYSRVGTAMGKVTADNDIYVASARSATSRGRCSSPRSTSTTTASAAGSPTATCSAAAPASTSSSARPSWSPPRGPCSAR